MHSVRTKILIIFLIISFFPLFCMSIFSYTVSSKAIKEKAGREVLNSLEHIGKNTEEKIQTVNRYMSTFISSEKFKKTIKNGLFNSADYQTIVDWKELNDILSSVLNEDRLVKSLYIYNTDKCVYVYRNDFVDKEELQKSTIYKKTFDNYGSLFTDVVNINDLGYNMVFGRCLRDVGRIDNEVFGLIFVFVDEKIFSNIFNVKGISQSGEIFIADAKGKILSHSDESKISENILGEPAYSKVYGDKETDYYEAKIHGKKTLVAYSTIKNWNIKVVETMPMEDYTKELRSILFITGVLGFLLFCSLILISMLMSIRITKPVKDLKTAMKRLRNGDFDSRTAISTKDEFGEISDSFNYMAEKLRELVEKLLAEERLRSETELDMLQYQINPHFLYNTLSSIRFSAITNGDMKTAEMLQVLSRLLKRTLGSAGKLVPMEAEILNVKDYIYIQQMQYNSKINVEYNITEEIMEYMIPNLLLQPMIENAIFHGLDRNMDKPTIFIVGKKEEGNIIFYIRDNGKGMSDEKIKEMNKGKDSIQKGFNNVGIKNVNMRLKLNYGREYGLKIDSTLGKGTTVEVKFPTFNRKGEEDV